MFYKLTTITLFSLISCNATSDLINLAAPKPWPKGKIYYEIAEGFSEDYRSYIQRGMQEWSEKTGFLLFEPRANQKNYVIIQPAKNCSSYVGMKGGAQRMNLSEVGCSYQAITHEFGHLIGLWHEHQRSDRDAYIRVNWLNIRPEKITNFFTLSLAKFPIFGPYDKKSIMHYDEHDFSSNGKKTFIFLDNYKRSAIPRRITELDVLKVYRFYHQKKIKEWVEFSP